MEPICTTDADIEMDADFVKLLRRFDEVQVYFTWYGVAMPTVATVGVVLNVITFRCVEYFIVSNNRVSRPAKCPGISGSLEEWGVISRSPGSVKKSPGVEGI